jgi:hypothetical protein
MMKALPPPLLLLLLGLLVPVAAQLEAYTGHEPADAASDRFRVSLQEVPAAAGRWHGTAPPLVAGTPLPPRLRTAAPAVEPHVYMTSSPDSDLELIHKDGSGRGVFCSLHGAQFCNRTVSWVEFGSAPAAGTEVLVTVTSLAGLVFTAGQVYASPLSYGLHVDVLPGGAAVQLRIKAGTNARFSIEYGSAPSGSFRDSLLIFAGPPDPTFPHPTPPNTLTFPVGVTRVPGDGILQLPRGVDTIFLPRGSWLDGRINITRHGSGPVRVVGHGVMSGRRFIYKGGKQCDWLRCIEVQYDRPLLLSGPTLGTRTCLPANASPSTTPTPTQTSLHISPQWLYRKDGSCLGYATQSRPSLLSPLCECCESVWRLGSLYLLAVLQAARYRAAMLA